MNDRLKGVAEQMRSEARSRGRAQRRLSGGLILTLQFKKETGLWVLSLTRYLQRASDTEQEICLAAFNVPSDHQWQMDYRKNYGIIRFSWLEPRPRQMSFIEEGAVDYYHD